MGEHSEGLEERMDERFDDAGRRFDDMDRRFGEASRRTDERFGDMDRRMDEGFNRVDTEMKLRFKVVDERFAEVGEHLGRMDVDIRELRVAVDGMQRVMLQGAVALSVSIVGTGFVTLGGLIAF